MKNAKCYEEKSYYYQIYHFWKMNHLFTKTYIRKKKIDCYGFMPSGFKVICGSMVGKNLQSLISTETPGELQLIMKLTFFILETGLSN